SLTQKRSFERENVLQFGLSIPLPFFNREQGNIAEASSERAQAKANREALEASIRREVSLAYRRYQAVRNSLEVLGSGVLEQNRESYKIVQLAYNLGQLRFLDTVNQQRTLIDVETT